MFSLHGFQRRQVQINYRNNILGLGMNVVYICYWLINFNFTHSGISMMQGHMLNTWDILEHWTVLKSQNPTGKSFSLAETPCLVGTLSGLGMKNPVREAGSLFQFLSIYSCLKSVTHRQSQFCHRERTLDVTDNISLCFLTQVLFALSSHNGHHIHTFQQTEFSQSSLWENTLQFNIRHSFLFLKNESIYFTIFMNVKTAKLC